MRLTTALITTVVALLLLVPSVAAAGTVALVKDIWPGDESDADLLMAAGNIVYFQADDGVHGRELWRSDGTEAGTFMVVDGLPGSKSANPEPIGAVGNVMYFNGKDSVHGHELWRTTGDGTGAKFVKDITPGKDSTDFGSSIALNGKLLFSGNGGLYATNGTAVGTKPIGPAGHQYVTMGGRVYYLTGSSNLDFRVWRSDGTATGTKQVGWSPTNITYIATTGTRLYMVTNSGELNSGPPALWVSDGTKAGTQKLTTDGALGKSSRLAPVGDRIEFFDHTDSGDRIWRSNGSVSGTKVMSSLPGAAAGIYAEGGAAYVPVDMGDGTEQIWVSWGTIGGTHSIATITSTYTTEEWATLGSTVYFQSYDAYGSDTWTIWQTNGTTAGTSPSVSGGPADGYPFEVTAAGDKLIFSGDDGVTGRELWSYTP